MSDLLDANTEETTKYYAVRESCDYEFDEIRGLYRTLESAMAHLDRVTVGCDCERTTSRRSKSPCGRVSDTEWYIVEYGDPVYDDEILPDEQARLRDTYEGRRTDILKCRAAAAEREAEAFRQKAEAARKAAYGE